jgi:hypothetical protein
LKKPLTLRCCTRSNWITRYLDEGDCELFLSNGNKIEIIGVENGLMTCLGEDNTYSAMETSEIYANNQLEVRFHKHLSGIELDFSVEGFKQIYELNIKERCRCVAKTEDQDGSMKHIVMLKKKASEGNQKYEVFWGNYF